MPSVVRGTRVVQLIEAPLSTLIDDCAYRFGNRTAVCVPWQGVNISYLTLAQRSRMMSKALLGVGLKHGDIVGIMAGNRFEYIETFLAGGRIGCPVVLMNNMFSPAELEQAMDRVTAESRVMANDILNLQFTSGTTGRPKAACLTHRNILNDAMFVGAAMKLTPVDVVSCPPPLFHCFGLVMGFLAAFYHGSSIVFPFDTFDAEKTVESVLREKVTALLGVPTMFFAQLELLDKQKGRFAPFTTVRTGLAAGAQVPAQLMNVILKRMNIPSLLIAYGMTETSPVTFITAIEDTEEKRFNTIGRVLPHTDAKIVDSCGRILPVGQRGEICTAGFPLQRGYWHDEEKTQEVMREDENGVRWMHTGDEGYLDADGYGYVTGRIKDLIIRGLEDKKYGEAVACFLKASDGAKPSRPSHVELRSWVSQTLGRHKEPKHIFWVGDEGVGTDLIKTASGKYQKHLIRALGNGLLKKSSPPSAKL
ncbi:hypothetical protein SCUCBS95973_004134 [Sporothrix curviconia]|uniref:AMP-dependent synthetase/ligase domain-containing protein n=1 Tax=Sporothrix curviconia TaxID=1260050 RepID=A0ABP0BLP9_9PEZI